MPYLKNISDENQKTSTGLGGGKILIKPNEILKFSERRKREILRMYPKLFKEVDTPVFSMFFVRENWDKLLTILFSFVALILSFFSYQKSDESIEISKKANTISEKANTYSEDANKISKKAYELAVNTDEWQKEFTEKKVEIEKQKIRQERLAEIRDNLDNGWDFNKEVFRKLRNKEKMKENYNFLRFIDPFEEAEDAIIRGEIFDRDIESKFGDELFLSCSYQKKNKEKLNDHTGFKNLCKRIFNIKL